MICVYAYPAGNQGASDFGQCVLSILTEYKSNGLGFLTRCKSGPYDPSLVKDVTAALKKLGVQEVRQTEV
jgi:hypothetical protein